MKRYNYLSKENKKVTDEMILIKELPENGKSF